MSSLDSGELYHGGVGGGDLVLDGCQLSLNKFFLLLKTRNTFNYFLIVGLFNKSFVFKVCVLLFVMPLLTHLLYAKV